MTGDAPAERVRAVVDRDECFGFGFCAGLLPDVFHLDEEGRSVVMDVEADPALLAQAADNCPRSAITVVGFAAPGREAEEGDRPAGSRS
jgi:ferredoxin